MSEGYNYTGKRYIASVRVSNDTDGTTSTQAQLAMLHEKAAELKMVCVGENILNGVTGSMPGRRDDMEQLIRRKKESNDFDVLIIQRLDRLTRSGPNHGSWFEHECARAGIHLWIVGDDICQGPYATVIKSMKYQSAQDQAFSISQRSTQGYQLALEEDRVSPSSRTPYACWRLYRSNDKQPLHIIRDLKDGRQQKLHHQSHELIETYGQLGGGSMGHYRKQKYEKPLIMPGDAAEVANVREIFELHFRQGWGGKRIADRLNRKGVMSSHGRNWSQHQVEVIYNNEVYTGINVANRTTSGIYHQRNHAAPIPTNLDPTVLANAKTIPITLRPPSEWVIKEEPLMRDFLGDEQLRELATVGQDRYWKHVADPNRPKMPKNKHKTSDYLLSGILHAKQDGGTLVGVLCGRVGKKTRYYRHRRGRTGYLKGSSYNKLVHADTVERTVLEVVKETLLNSDDLRQQLLALIDAESKSSATVDVADLQRRRTEAEERRQALERQRQEEERLRLEEQRLLKNLEDDAASWRRANNIRQYVDVVERAVLTRMEKIASESELGRWIEWSRRQADQIDPIRAILVGPFQK